MTEESPNNILFISLSSVSQLRWTLHSRLSVASRHRTWHPACAPVKLCTVQTPLILVRILLGFGHVTLQIGVPLRNGRGSFMETVVILHSFLRLPARWVDLALEAGSRSFVPVTLSVLVILRPRLRLRIGALAIPRVGLRWLPSISGIHLVAVLLHLIAWWI